MSANGCKPNVRLIYKLENGTRVYWCREFEEYVVLTFDQKIEEGHGYFTDDKQDAIDTAADMDCGWRPGKYEEC
jgi:hypothetical protein